jgi:hypothetical protein
LKGTRNLCTNRQGIGNVVDQNGREHHQHQQ